MKLIEHCEDRLDKARGEISKLADGENEILDDLSND